MADTFTYDLVSFLRVLYRRRYFILLGSFFTTLLVAVVVWVWPETWRADARILVSTPQFKENLLLVPTPFDVMTYQGIMTSPDLYLEVRDTLIWYKDAVTALQSPEAQERIRAGIPSAENLTPIQVISRTDVDTLKELLYPSTPNLDSIAQFYIEQIERFSVEELDTINKMNRGSLLKVTVFTLRKSLHTGVEIVKETNLETIYSNLIDVAAEFDTAVGSKILVNTWIGLFMIRAEEIARDVIFRQVGIIYKTRDDLRKDIWESVEQLLQYTNEVSLEMLHYETASKLVALTGVAPERAQLKQSEESFDTGDVNRPFLVQQKSLLDLSSFHVTPLYQEALIPRKLQMEREAGMLGISLSGTSPENGGSVNGNAQQLRMEYKAIVGQITALSLEITKNIKAVETREKYIAHLQRDIQRKIESLDGYQNLLAEARILTSLPPDTRYSDIQPNYAITPDKRVFPKRTYMVLAGAVISFVLFCALSFFLDIWKEVTMPEDITATPDAVV